MLATYVNCALVILGSLLGLAFRKKITPHFMTAMTEALSLCVMVIGMSGAIRTENVLCMVLCMVLGTLLGVGLKIEKRLDSVGEWLRKKVDRKGNSSQFTQGFVSSAILFCVGSMTIMGSIEAGINHDYSILLTKAVMDGAAAISFAATMGISVAFAALPMLLYQGGLTLLAQAAAPILTVSMVTEMSAIGGAIILGVGFNLLFPEKHISIGNMLPAIFLPLIYLPLIHWIGVLI